MPRYIDADKLREAMHHEAFETDTDMQKWDSGCWIRYRMFERAIKDAPTIDAVEVVRCKDCKYATMTTDGRYCKYCELVTDDDGREEQVYFDANWFCADGTR